MEIFESKNEFRLVKYSVPMKGKVRCGDYIHFTEIRSEQLVVLALSDGVGSVHHDCEASETACGSFIEFFKDSDISDITNRFEQALKDTDKAVSDPLETNRKGMMCTFIGVVWDKKQNSFLYANIGDSRLYKLSVNGIKQISVDDKKAVLMRDKSGNLLSHSGTLIVREGLTNAMGYNGVRINIASESLDVGESLILSSDGMYDVPNFTEEIIETLKMGDLDKAIEKFITKNKEVFNDDASILILQRTLIPDEVIPQILKAIDEKIICREQNLPEHLVTKWMMDEFLNLIGTRDGSGLEKMTEYVNQCDLKLSELFIERAMEEMKKQKFVNTLFYNMLIVQLKKLRW